MQIETHTERGATIVNLLNERADARIAPAFKDKMTELISNNDDLVLILDLSAVRFMDSSMLGALVAAYKLLAGRGELKVVVADGPVAQLFRLTRMDRVFLLFDNIEQALA